MSILYLACDELTTQVGFNGIFFVFVKLLFLLQFDDAIFDLAHDVEAIFHLSQLLTASEHLF